jgi:methyl-accepting chemotaxis protein
MNITTSLKAKLLVGFGSILALMLIMAGLAAWQIRTSDVAADDIASNFLPSIHDLGQMEANANKIRRLQYGHILASTPEKKAQYDRDIAACIAEFNEHLADFQKLDMDAEETALAKEAARLWTAVVEGNQAVTKPSHAGNRDEAFARLADLAANTHACIATLDKLDEINGAEANAAKEVQDQAVTQAYWTIAIAAAVSLAVGIVLALRIARGIVVPVTEVGTVLTALSAGDLTKRTAVTSRDEVGVMADTLNSTMDGLRGMVGGIGQNAQGIAGAAEELTAISTQLSASAETAAGQAGQAAAAATQVATSIQTCAAGIEEMTASVDDIAKNAGQAASVAQEGVTAVQEADATMTRLGTSSSEIGSIVTLITRIAEQTNLLALNAAIEAASAGEAGRGFAVVASEVKNLAGQTSEATADIGRRVAAIQGDASSAQGALHRISDIVTRISALQTSIAAAVEQQSATTKEIGHNLGQVAKAGTDISQNVTAVADAARESSAGSVETLKAATELSRLASELRQAVGRFRT